MKLNNYFIFIILLICLQYPCPYKLYSQALSDSLISPRLYKISYLSPDIPQLKKYYTKVIKNSSIHKDNKKTILANIYLAETFRYEQKHDSSTYFLKESKRLISKYQTSDDFLKYQYFKANASNQYFMYDYSRLLEYSDSAMRLAIKHKYDSVEVADLLFLKFTAYNMTYKYDSALFYLVSSLSNFPKGYKEYRLYKYLPRLSTLYKDNGYLKKAEETLYEALKKCNPSIPSQKSKTYYSLGQHYIDICDYEKSIQYYKLKLDNDSISGINDSLERSKTLKEIGDAFRYQKKYETAIKYYIKAKTLLPNTPSDQLVKIHRNIGLAYRFNDSLELAKYHFNMAVKIAIEEKGLISDITKALALINLGSFEVNILKSKKGIHYLDTALILLEKCYGSKSRLLGYSYNILSDAYKNLYGDYVRSMGYLQKSLQLNMPDVKISNYQQKLNPDSSVHLIELISILDRKINLLNKWICEEKNKKEIESVITALHNTIITYTDAEELNRTRIRNPESKLTRGSLHKEYYTKALNGLHLLFDKTQDEKYLHLMYKYSAQNKAISLQELLKESKTKFSLIPDSLIKLESDYNRKIGSLKELITREYEQEHPNVNKINRWDKEVKNAALQKDFLIHDFETNFPGYYKLKHDKQHLAVKEVQSRLKDNQTLIEYSVLNDSCIFVFGISKNEFIFKPLKADTNLFPKLETLLKLINNDKIHRFNINDFNTFKYSSYYLYQSLIEPIAQIIKGKELIINPDDKLWYLPFEVLLSDTINPSNNYKDFSYLIKRNPINYAYSTRLFFNPIANKRKAPYNLLAMVPSYEKDIDFTTKILEENKSNRGNFCPLPASLEEAKHIQDLLGGKLLIGDQASEKKFKEIADKYSILHLAMHAVIDNNNPQYSKLVFTQAVDINEDNFLNTYEIYNKPLNAQMVVLSSCNSGNGKMQKGEGIISIARAFLYAGCPSLVITLWSVNDRTSAKLMQYYYDFLKQGMNKSTALQQSKIKFLKTASPIQQHPYFWASYTIIGVNDPIDLKKSKNIYYILSGILLLLLIFSKRIRSLIEIVKN